MNNKKNNSYLDMSTTKLIKTLKEYSQARSGEIADLTYVAAVRLGVLDAKIKKLEREEDDWK